MKADMRMEQRECADDILDRSDLGGVALQELQPRRNIGEEVSNLDRHSRKQRSRSLFDRFAGPDANSPSATRAFDIGDLADAGDRLAPKAEADDRVTIIDVCHLTGRV